MEAIMFRRTILLALAPAMAAAVCVLTAMRAAEAAAVSAQRAVKLGAADTPANPRDERPGAERTERGGGEEADEAKQETRTVDRKLAAVGKSNEQFRVMTRTGKGPG